MTMLKAEATIPTTAAQSYVAAVCARLAEADFETEAAAGRGRIQLIDGLGTGTLEAGADRLHVRLESRTEQGLSVLKFVLSSQIEEVAAAEKPEVVWTGDGCDLDVLPSLRELTVLRVADVTPHVRRITFTGKDLRRFEGDSLHVRLLFPPAGVHPPEWPKPGKNGRPLWPPEGRRPVQRVYTMRRIDAAAGEMDIDFVLHAAPGVASDWAASARAGAVIGVMGPGGREMRPAAHVLLAGDETAIPAMARILERLPAQTSGQALIEVENEAEVQDLVHPAGVTLLWLFRRGREPGRNDLLADAVMAAPLPDHDDVVCWLGAEEAIARRIRAYWRDEKGLDRARCMAVGYWKHGLTGDEAA
jgi:NADPH-dependent ferric siderophore reductase